MWFWRTVEEDQWRASGRHHTDRGVHVSSSGVIATPAKSGNSSPTHCSVAGSVVGERDDLPPLGSRSLWGTVSSEVMALVLPSVQGGGASTRTSLAVRTDQIRGTHELQCVHGRSSVQLRMKCCSLHWATGLRASGFVRVLSASHRGSR